jgi:CMP-N-acetylneuraminic acid synthetase
MKIAMMPIRSGSKGVPDKNIREFRGKPLFYWNLKALLDSGMFDEVYVSTDDMEYFYLVEEYFENVVFAMRPERLAGDDATTIRVVQDFIEGADMEDGDYFALTQATSPYLSVGCIKEAFRHLGGTKYVDDERGVTEVQTLYTYKSVRSYNYDSVMTAGRMKKFLWTDKGEGLNVAKNAHKRRQDWRGTLVQNGCFYLTTAGMIRDTGMLWGGKVGFVEQPYYFDIDEEADFIYGEEVMK